MRESGASAAEIQEGVELKKLSSKRSNSESTGWSAVGGGFGAESESRFMVVGGEGCGGELGEEEEKIGIDYVDMGVALD